MQLDRLIERAKKQGGRFMLRFTPSEGNEAWGVKYFPEEDDDANFWAYSSSLEDACHQVLSEMEGFK